MTALDSPPILVSRYGNHVVAWPLSRLMEVLGQLRHERQHAATMAEAKPINDLREPYLAGWPRQVRLADRSVRARDVFEIAVHMNSWLGNDRT
jgi:hypothetical protein